MKEYFTVSNSAYVYDGCSFLDNNYQALSINGPSYEESYYPVVNKNVFGSSARSAGKLKLEFNFRFESTLISTLYVYYQVGVCSPDHDRTALLGNTANSWAFDNETIALLHNSSSTSLSYPFTNADDAEECGVYVGYQAANPSRKGVLLLAIDFDAGKMWFGWGISFTTESGSDAGDLTSAAAAVNWDGDPEAGTDPSFTFTANTPLIPAATIKFREATVNSTGVLCVATAPEQQFYGLPNGFSYWDQPYHLQEMLADSPYGLWLAGTHKGSVINNIGMTSNVTQNGDSSGNLRFARLFGSLEGYSYVEYMNSLLGNSALFFPAQPSWGSYSYADGSYADFAPPYNGSYTVLSIEASICVTGNGAINGTNGTWDEGSGIFGVDASVGSVTPFGLSLRGRRLVLGFDTLTIADSNDLADGAHHVAFTFEGSTALKLYLDGALLGEIISSVPVSGAIYHTTNGIVVGSILPEVTGGSFPGFIRDVAVYKSVLSATRIAAHYEHLQTTANPTVVRRNYDRCEAVFPSFTV